jgi:hypothetical protein
VPFFALLPRLNKQKPGVLVRVSIVLLTGRWLDLYLMIMPPFSAGKPRIGIWEIGMAAGLVGVFLLGLLAALRKAPLIPVSRSIPGGKPSSPCLILARNESIAMETEMEVTELEVEASRTESAISARGGRAMERNP